MKKFGLAKTTLLEPEVFGATQHTPVLLDNHFYRVRADGKFVCLRLEGKQFWTSGSGPQFGLSPFLVADGLIFALNDSVMEVSPATYER